MSVGAAAAQARDLAYAECQTAGGPLGPAFFEEHLVVVARRSRELAGILGADGELVELAAYLHDLSAVRDIASLPCHAQESSRLAGEFLRARALATPVVEEVCRCIESHTAPIARGGGTPEEICLSNADAMAQIERPAYWLYFAYRVRGLGYREGIAWLKTRVEQNFGALIQEARGLVALEYASTARFLGASL